MPPIKKTTGEILIDKAVGAAKYDAGPIAHIVTKPEKAVQFFSKILGLRLELTKKVQTDIGVTLNEPMPVLFKAGSFVSDQEEYIEKMREHGSFGGSKRNNFNDVTNSGTPLFWEESLPDGVIAQRTEEQKELSMIEGWHEPDKKDFYFQ